VIAVDWGTSSLRAYRLDHDGAVLELRSAAAGLLACNGAFETVLAQQLSGWDDPIIVMAGMIGSRTGWREVPYVDCPAGAEQIAAGMLEVSAATFAGRRIFITPGVCHRPAGGTPEVMRGEEVQLLGLVDRLAGSGPHTLCLPGTHSKWAILEHGRVTSFRTAMTGELYAVLTRHSLLAASMDNDAGDDPAAFASGLARAGSAGGLPSHLFSVRTLALFGELTPAQAPSYLSGLLIGHELEGLAPPSGCVHVIGSAALTRRYERALRARGLEPIVHSDALSAPGLQLLARRRHLID
jgi:2-dehydro-3-deoxygalactonokinase